MEGRRERGEPADTSGQMGKVTHERGHNLETERSGGRCKNVPRERQRTLGESGQV